MKQALVLGCSHAAGSEMASDPAVTYQTLKEFEEYGYSRSYPAKIAQTLGYQVQNRAIPGGSNDAMFRIFESANLDSNDMVIACWSGFDRSELWYEKEHRWLSMAHGSVNCYQKISNSIIADGINAGTNVSDAALYQDYGKQWAINEGNPHRGRLNKLKNILAVNALAQAKGIPVVNIHSFNSVEVSNYNWPVGTIEFYNWCCERKFPHTDWGHFFEPAHQAFADFVLEHVKIV